MLIHKCWEEFGVPQMDPMVFFKGSTVPHAAQQQHAPPQAAATGSFRTAAAPPHDSIPDIENGGYSMLDTCISSAAFDRMAQMVSHGVGQTCYAMMQHLPAFWRAGAANGDPQATEAAAQQEPVQQSPRRPTEPRRMAFVEEEEVAVRQ
jgi:hypothetical protein